MEIPRTIDSSLDVYRTEISVSSDNDKLRHDLESEIQEHYRAIRSLKARVNTLATIAKLPPELLAEIFIQHAADRHAMCDRDPSYLPYWKWTTILQVCSHWRSVALDCPRLWSRLVVSGNFEWTAEVIRRSRKAPLDVTARLDTHASNRVGKMKSLELIMREFPRIRNLKLSAGREWLRTVFGSLDLPAPVLQSVVILPTLENSLSTTLIPQPPSFVMDGKAPCLTTVELHQYPFPWKVTTSLPPLKRFKVTHCYSDPVPLMTDILRVLDQLPLLEVLELEFILPAISDDITELPAVCRKVNLPGLKSMRLCAKSIECANFLNHLCLPAGVVYTLTCRGRNGADKLAAVLSEKLASSGNIRTLATGLDPATYRTVVRGSVVDTFDPNETDLSVASSIFDVAFCSSASMLPLNEVMMFCESMPLSSVRNLTVSSVHLSMYVWCKAFGQIANLQNLRFSGNAAEELPLILESRADSHSENVLEEDRNFRLQELRTLYLHAVRFGTYEEVEERQFSQYTEDLRHSLTERDEASTAVQELVITSAINFAEPDLEELENAVERVKWDGEIIWEPSEADEEMEDFYDDFSDGGFEYDDPWDYNVGIWAYPF